MNQSTTNPDPNRGSAVITVTFKAGGSEAAQVRQIPSSEFRAYGPLIEVSPVDRELEEAAFYVAGKTAEWAGTLDDDSLDRLLWAGQRLNLEPYGKWYSRMQARFIATTESETLINRAEKIRGGRN